MVNNRICSIEGCGHKIKAKGLCQRHYDKMRRRGNPLIEDSTGGITVHGESRRGQHSTEYIAWTNMRQRCNNKNHWAYHYYGGRGIKVCERWNGPHGFVNFLKDMGKKPESEKRLTLDRIDCEGDYCPENCRWVDYHTQRMNQRRMN